MGRLIAMHKTMQSMQDGLILDFRFLLLVACFEVGGLDPFATHGYLTSWRCLAQSQSLW